MTDWLPDPLMIYKEGLTSYKQSKSLQNDAWKKWRTFHFATRLKLEAADHFCRLTLGAVSMPCDLGLPYLAYKQTKWYLDAFFFELMSAHETLLQELNVVYDINRDIEKVIWSSIKGKLPEPLKNLMESEWKAAWFKRLRWYRNTATHHAYIPIGAETVGYGQMPWDYEHHGVELCYVDSDTNESIFEDIKVVCPDYFRKMTMHIRAVWGKMAEEFD